MLITTGPAPRPAGPDPKPADDPTLTFLARHCQGCHSGEKPKGHFRTDRLTPDFADKANPKTFRFASTAPFYVEAGAGPPRVSRASARFFLAWIRERTARVKVDEPAERVEVLKYHTAAQKF